MRVGIILHGPEIIDSGEAKQVIDIFMKQHEVIAKLGGTMGRTAVLDAGLQDIIDISQGLTPSQTIISLKNSIEVAILLNHGKTLETGKYFGGIVASKLPASSPPLIHIERPSLDGRIFYYCERAKPCAEFARATLLEYYDLPVEKGRRITSHIKQEGNVIVRRIYGALPGENIRLEGVVIGEVTHEEPEIVCKNGKVVELRGIKVKPHGLEKLRDKKINLYTARVKTGNIRRSKYKPRIKPVRRNTYMSTVIIDHCAEATFELIKNAALAITVGDDTTNIAADILTRLGIPVIGIIDGDLDGVLQNTAVPSGSVIIRMKSGFDDHIGKAVFKKLMNGKQVCMLNMDETLMKILELADGCVEDVVYY